MPRGTRSITEAVKAVAAHRDALTKVLAEIAAEKAAVEKKAKATPST